MKQCSCAFIFAHFAHETVACSAHPVFAALLIFEEGQKKMQTSGNELRECETVSTVIASAAKQSIYPRAEMWIASLRSQ